MLLKRRAHRARESFIIMCYPDVAKKSIHKSSQQVTSTKSSLAKGWMTVSQHAIMLGVDRQDPDFKQLAEAACEGLPIRDHENKAREASVC